MTEDRTKTDTTMDPRPSSPTENLEELVNTLRASLLPAPTPPTSASASPMALPAVYAGDPAGCGGFLLQLSLHIEMQPQMFPTERSKVAFLISLLSDQALTWAKAIWNAKTAINSYEAFTNHFKEVFGSATGALSAADQLLCLRQGSSSTHEYTVKFSTLAATCGWNESALLCAYRQGLDVRIRAQMAIYDDTMGLESFMQKAKRISQHLAACHPAEAAHQPTSPANGSPVPEPMQINLSRLSARERARRWTAGLCLYCASSDHYIQACPFKPPRPAVSTLQTDPIISKLTVLNVQLLTPVQSVAASALVDSGSSGNFISQDLIDRLHLPHQRKTAGTWLCEV